MSIFACQSYNLNLLLTVSQDSVDNIRMDARIIDRVNMPCGSDLLNSIPSSNIKLHLTVINPSPSIRLNTGPATQPVTAISPNPLREIDILANASPTELPQESTVSPRIAVLIPVSMPNRIRRSTITLAII